MFPDYLRIQLACLLDHLVSNGLLNFLIVITSLLDLKRKMSGTVAINLSPVRLAIC